MNHFDDFYNKLDEHYHTIDEKQFDNYSLNNHLHKIEYSDISDILDKYYTKFNHIHKVNSDDLNSMFNNITRSIYNIQNTQNIIDSKLLELQDESVINNDSKTVNQQYKEDPFYYADDYSEWLKKSFYHYGSLKEGDPNTKQKFFD